MLRVSLACALLAAGAPAAEATLGKHLSGANKTDGTADESHTEKLNKFDLGKLRLDNLKLERLYPENPAFPEFKLDLPPLNGGFAAERFPLLGLGSASSPEAKTGLQVNLQELKEQLANSLPGLGSASSPEAKTGLQVNLQELKEQLANSLPGLGSASSPEAKTGLKVDLQELKEQLANSLPQFKPKIHVGSSEETPESDTSGLNANTEMHAFAKAGENLGRLGQLFKQRDHQKILPSLALIGKNESRGFDAAGSTETEDLTVDAHTENEDKLPMAGLFSQGKPLSGLFPESKGKPFSLAGKFNDFALPDLALNGLKLLKFPNTADSEDKDEYQTEFAHSSKGESEGLAPRGESGSADLSRAPVRRLTLLPVLSNALQRIDRKAKRDEENFQAFEKGVKQLQTDIKRDLASTLGTRRRPADLQFLERVLAKVGLNGLGGPSPLDLSIQERAIMDQARRKRPQVEKIKSKYERDIKYLVNDLQGSLRGSTNYKQRISDIVNNTMYTGAALLSV